MDYYDQMRLQHVLLHGLVPLLLSFSLGSHAQSSDSTESQSKSSALSSTLFYQLLLGELNARSEDSGAAFSLMLDAARKTGDPAVYKRAVQIAIQARAGESALQAAKAWTQATPASREANLFVLQILLGLNRVADTLEPLKREIALTPVAERRELLWRLPALYERVDNRPLAATTVQKALGAVLADKDLGATAWAVVGRFWLSAGDKTAALGAATKAQAIDLQSEHPALLALSMMSPDLPQAEMLVRQHLPQARPEFRMAYIKALLGAKREADAKAELENIKVATPDYADAWLISGALALQLQQLDRSQQQLQHYLDLVERMPAADRSAEVRRGRSQALMSMAQIAQLRREPEQAQAWLQRVDNPEDVLRAQLQRASLIAQQGRLEEALALIQSLPESSEADVRLKRATEISLLREQKLFERARDKLKLALAQTPNDADLVYDLAMVNEKLGHLDEMEQLLRSLIAANPQDPNAYNALGYSLADRNLRLAEARQLITKALELSPGDPFITDSLAWAEFRSGNHAEALRLLQAAFKDKPDAEIAAHLGEVLWISNRQPEATQVFQQGIKLNPANETLLETIKRLRVPL
ncbi:MAG: tetratricopeptide repeat protein [Rhodoferax sp.]|jgi:tetratricopeptide (TPR) repeat protein|nr:tetratricopeptide repeat protein [Rhodoferax sp.]